MTQRVYGIVVGGTHGHNADSLSLLTNEEKLAVVAAAREENEDEVEEYELNKWFYYLNADMIDTENYYWFVA